MSSPVTFQELSLDPRLLGAIERLGYTEATPVQAEAIPSLLEGRDIVASARTGSGKTAAFGLPLLQRIADGGGVPRALVLAPTRELALQVNQALVALAHDLSLATVCVYGGASYTPQLRALDKGVDVVVGTPGRILDHLERGSLDLSAVEVVVLDEADEMLRMGFLEDVERILEAVPEQRQMALFSATMPPPIQRIARARMRDPVHLQVEERVLSVDHIEQRWMMVPTTHRIDALARVLRAEPHEAALVFARTRAECAEVADALSKAGIPADAQHGDMNQAARERVLARLRAGGLRVLVATDVAARGLDVEHISHVINLEIPESHESYVHRIGRTGRAGRRGVAITFVGPRQRWRLKQLEEATGVALVEVAVPSDLDIARGKRRGLLSRLASLVDNGDLVLAMAAADELASQQGWSVEELSAAALHLLAQVEGIPLGGNEDDAPPDWAQQKQRRTAAEHAEDNVDHVELFVPMGRMQKVRPADLVGALANDCGIPGTQIGRITIADRKSFVGLPRDLARRLVDEFDVLVVRGREVPLKVARPHSPQSDDRPPRRFPKAERSPARSWPDRRGKSVKSPWRVKKGRRG